MFLSKISIKRPILMTMVIMVFILFGGLAYFSLNLNLMPDIDIPFILIKTVYPGASPNEIESQVTKKIEDEISTIPGIKEITSYSMSDVSIVQIEFKLSKDVNIAEQEAKSKVDRISNKLPDGAEKPAVNKWELGARPVITLCLQGDLPAKELYQLADKSLKDIFSQIQGVARVDLTGGEEREIRVQLDDRKIYQNNINLLQLNKMVSAGNISMPVGQYTEKSKELSVRLNGEFSNLDELRELEIPTSAGLQKVKNFAKVSDSSKDIKKRTIFFDNVNNLRNDNIVKINLIKSSDGNAVNIATEIRKKLPDIISELPTGVKLNIINDFSIFTKSSVDDTINNIIIGIILTSLILLVFLHDIRSTFIIAIAMPVSIISTFILLQLAGFSLNVMTLMGLSSSVGVLVANSVVVLENIFRHKNMGRQKKDAADIGTAEVVVAVFASTLTNVAVFLPIASMTSMAGQFFKEFALTVTFATFFSLFISFTLTPMLASIILPDKQTFSRIGNKLEKVFKSWEKFYQSILRFFLKNKFVSFLSIAISFLLFAFMVYLGFVSNSKIGFEFIPLLDEGDIEIIVELPQGTSLETTGKTISQVENIVAENKNVKHILTTLGESNEVNIGANLAIIKVKLLDVSERDVTTNQVNSTFIKKLATIPNVSIRSSVKSSVGSGAPDIEFFIKGMDLERLIELEHVLMEKCSDIPGLANFDCSLRSDKPEIILIPNRDNLIEVGLTVYDLALILRGGIEGMVSTQYKDKGESYDIKVTMFDESVNSVEKISALPIPTKVGNIRLDQLVKIETEKGVNSILRKGKVKALQFTGSPAVGFSMGNIVDEINRRVNSINLPQGYSLIWGGNSRLMKETNLDMARAFLIAFVLTYMLLAAILESFVQPLFILGTVPLAIIGVILILMLSGQTMNMFSMLSIIMLLGLVVNNAILMLDYSNQLYREKGFSAKDALLEACPTKLKPIIMSTLAIVLGMLPMALGIGSAGKEFRQSMGLVTVGGLIASTIFALIVIPALYYLFSKKR